MLTKIAFVLIVLFSALRSAGQNKPVSFEDLASLQTTEARPVIVLIMTDWCKYCHAMQNAMLKNQRIAAVLKSRFHTIFLDAEEKKDIIFAGRTFKYKSGTNELARQLAANGGKVAYPTLCILNSKNEIIYQHEGYLSPPAILYTLKKISAVSNSIN